MQILRTVTLVTTFMFGTAFGQTMYVSDELVITLRSGPSTQNAVIANLTSGDQVVVLETDNEIGYSRVRVTDSGDEGWVLTRFLKEEPTAALELVAERRELESARDAVVRLEAEVMALTEQLESVQSSLGETRSSNSQLSEELRDIRDVSANAIELRDQNESLRRRNNSMSQEVEQLTEANRQLANRDDQNWFVVGALVLAGGIVIGLIAPSLRRRRRSTW